MKLSKHILVGILLLLIVMVFTGCESKNTEELVVGKWKQVDKEAFRIFSADGKLHYESFENGEKTFEIDYLYRITGDKLGLKSGENEWTENNKIKSIDENKMVVEYFNDFSNKYFDTEWKKVK